MSKYRIFNKQGIALLLSIIYMIGLAGIVTAYLFIASQGTKFVGIRQDETQAFYIAEGGLERGILYVSTTLGSDSDWSDNNGTIYSGVSLGEGTYTVELENGAQDSIDVKSTGTIGAISRVVRQTVTRSGVPQAFSYAQHSDGNINLNNSDGTITGDISAGGSINSGDMSVSGSTTESSSVSAPSVNMSSYQGDADYDISGNYTFSSGTYSGIYYIDGNVTIQDEVTINGTIVTTGNINMNNADDLSITPTGDNPALVASGNIRGNNLKDSSITGLIYTEGNIRMDGIDNVTFNGAFVAQGDIRMRNADNLTITYDSDVQSTPYFSGGGGISVSSWQEI